jgi:hypothetical protein
MREYVKFNFDAEAQLQEIIPATLATPQEQSSKSSESSTGVPPLPRYFTPEEMVQGSADVERGDLHDGDRGRATFATSATQEAQSSESSESSRGAVPAESAEDAPAQYWSDVLQERFWVAPTATQAAALAGQGQVVCQPDELWRLRDLQARGPAAFPAKLRAIHQAKTLFGVTVTHDTPTITGRVTRKRSVKPRDSRLGPILPPCATCGDLRYWHDHDADTWRCWTCTPPAPRRHPSAVMTVQEGAP